MSRASKLISCDARLTLLAKILVQPVDINELPDKKFFKLITFSQKV